MTREQRERAMQMLDPAVRRALAMREDDKSFMQALDREIELMKQGETLEPCECGARATVVHIPKAHPDDVWYVLCGECYSHGGESHTEQGARDSWDAKQRAERTGT